MEETVKKKEEETVNVKKIQDLEPDWEKEWGKIVCHFLYENDGEKSVLYKYCGEYEKDEATFIDYTEIILDIFYKKAASQKLFKSFRCDDNTHVLLVHIEHYLLHNKWYIWQAKRRLAKKEKENAKEFVRNACRSDYEKIQQEILNTPITLDYSKLRKDNGNFLIMAGLHLYFRLSDDPKKCKESAREEVVIKHEISEEKAIALIHKKHKEDTAYFDKKISKSEKNRVSYFCKIAEINTQECETNIYNLKIKAERERRDFCVYVLKQWISPLLPESIKYLLNTTISDVNKKQQRYREKLEIIFDKYIEYIKKYLEEGGENTPKTKKRRRV